ncbi:hypothetical protein CCR94_18255 [Rhodoblastus sphagnicola]|uniref:DUF5983 domain-containing protein n=1 Tax=Rhodoblastus sphagnicola TaxID=333368 RepID=A0A2S6N0V6_9HYPH|nr:hypothetical protein [Rhodoblastus sphagnicola]MBB4200599.1 hypothetical protein [Rhodoblastus sphagnicola]PPQ28242.1 hypothetical protein CCR94_18255 [Rhodoblastus sphagnicola]
MVPAWIIAEDGAFICGDRASGVTCNSEPTSIFAESAARAAGAGIAAIARLAFNILKGERARRLGHGLEAESDAANWHKINLGEAPVLICEGASEEVVVEQMTIWNAAWSRAKAEYLTAKRNKPFFYKLMPLSTGHLCAETREWLSDRPADDWPILGGVTEYGYFVHCPEEIHELPADLWACIIVAKSRGADYILFDQVEEILPNLIDFTEQDNESAIGMADARIETGARNDAVVLSDGVTLIFPKAHDNQAAAIETEMFRDAWRDLIGRDAETGALLPWTIEKLAVLSAKRREDLIHESRRHA